MARLSELVGNKGQFEAVASKVIDRRDFFEDVPQAIFLEPAESIELYFNKVGDIHNLG
jgi:hypothetical protein